MIQFDFLSLFAAAPPKGGGGKKLKKIKKGIDKRGKMSIIIIVPSGFV